MEEKNQKSTNCRYIRNSQGEIIGEYHFNENDKRHILFRDKNEIIDLTNKPDYPMNDYFENMLDMTIDNFEEGFNDIDVMINYYKNEPNVIIEKLISPYFIIFRRILDLRYY